MQPEDEQLSEGDCRHLHDPQESDHALRQALVCNLGLPGQRRQSGNVAKMLGHSNIKMTQHYARVLDSSILRDMMQVERAISKLG